MAEKPEAVDNWESLKPVLVSGELIMDISGLRGRDRVYMQRSRNKLAELYESNPQSVVRNATRFLDHSDVAAIGYTTIDAMHDQV